MIIDASLGFVLHKRAQGDTSVDVSFFTREQGLIRARATGGRTPKRQSILQPFTPLWLVFDEKKYGSYVRHMEVSSPTFVLPGQKVFAGLYVNELLYHVLHVNQEEPILFSIYEETIRHLAEANSVQRLECILRKFEWVLLETSGFQVSFIYEQDGFSPIVAGQQYRFIPASGFVVAADGLRGEHILAIAHQQLETIDVLKSAKLIMRRAIDHLLNGAPIRSRELYRA